MDQKPKLSITGVHANKTFSERLCTRKNKKSRKEKVSNMHRKRKVILVNRVKVNEKKVPLRILKQCLTLMSLGLKFILHAKDFYTVYLFKVSPIIQNKQNRK